GLLNLTHRDSHATPEPLEPGKRYRVTVELNTMAQSLPAGHRLRLAISTSYWPLAWPPPEPVRLSVFTGASKLRLPIRPIRGTDETPLRPFAEPEGTEPIPVTQVEEGEQRWTVSRDMVNYNSAVDIVKDRGVVRFDDIALELTRRARERYSWIGDDVTSAAGETEWLMGFEREEWNVSTITRTMLTADETNFYLHAELDAYEGDDRVASYNWNRTIPRDLV